MTAVVADLITPLIAAIGGQPDFGGLTFTVHRSTFLYGAFINAVISFLIIAAVVYFLIVAPMAKITARFHQEAEVTTRDCPECLSTIPIAASRCMYCTPGGPRWRPVTPPVQPSNPEKTKQLREGASRSCFLSAGNTGACSPGKSRVWARAGAWPSRAQTTMTRAVRLTSACDTQSGTASW